MANKIRRVTERTMRVPRSAKSKRAEESRTGGGVRRLVRVPTRRR